MGALALVYFIGILVVSCLGALLLGGTVQVWFWSLTALLAGSIVVMVAYGLIVLALQAVGRGLVAALQRARALTQ